jgi:catechol 2,3-dioxygenase-like lactoylglutathione lyase family enzyme
MAVIRIGRISFTTADADRLGAFYRQAFGFEAMEVPRGHVVCATDRRQGRASPRDPTPTWRKRRSSSSHSPSLVRHTRPISAARICDSSTSPLSSPTWRPPICDCAHVGGWTAITRPAPQPTSGAVTAFKFRDPEGHPLELLAFPPNNAPSRWRDAPHRDGPCLGIDHSAIVVSRTAASVAFYREVLGFSVAGRSLNRGREQEQLDAVPGAVVEVTALHPEAESPPHLELLCYRPPGPPRSGPGTPPSNDIAATRLTLEVDDPPALENRLAAARVRFISPGIVALRDNRPALLIRDLDGHALLLLGR